jgi:hypothetical protein
MPNTLDANGLQTASITEIFNNLVAGYQSIYGSDINVAANSPDGQALMILAEACVDNLELLVQVYNSFAVDSSFGVVLDQRVAMNGIQRKNGTYTQVYVTVTATAAVTIPGTDVLVANPSAVVFTVADAAGNNYQLVTSYAFGAAGSATLLFQAVNIGQVQTTPNTITAITTPLLFVSTVNNSNFSVVTTGHTHSGTAVVDSIPSTTGMTPGMAITDTGGSIPSGATILSVDSAVQVTMNVNSTASTASDPITVNVTPYTEGLPEEADPQLKIRRIHSFFLQSVGPADALRAALLQYQDVSDSYVVENDTAGTVNSVPAHSIYVIVNGGTPSEIAQAIYAKKAPGCGMYGSVTANVTRPQGNTFTAKWDAAVSQPLYIKATLTPRTGASGYDSVATAAALAAALVYKLGQSPSINDVIIALATIQPNFVTSVVNVSVDGNTWLNVVSPSGYINYFLATAANIALS